MKRKGFNTESTLQYAQRWLDVITAVCGANSFTNPASASSGEQGIKRACAPAVGTPSVVIGDTAAAAAQDQAAQEAPGTDLQPQPPSCTGAADALRSLLLQQQPSMIDRSGKHIGAAAFNSFQEVCQYSLQSWSSSSIYVRRANRNLRLLLTVLTSLPLQLNEMSS